MQIDLDLVKMLAIKNVVSLFLGTPVGHPCNSNVFTFANKKVYK